MGHWVTARRRLLTARYSPLTTCYSLLTAHHSPLATQGEAAELLLWSLLQLLAKYDGVSSHRLACWGLTLTLTLALTLTFHPCPHPHPNPNPNPNTNQANYTSSFFYPTLEQGGAKEYSADYLATVTVDPATTGRQWRYQQCAELGWFANAAPSNP